MVKIVAEMVNNFFGGAEMTIKKKAFRPAEMVG
jgi:hypothetical protein